MVYKNHFTFLQGYSDRRMKIDDLANYSMSVCKVEIKTITKWEFRSIKQYKTLDDFKKRVLRKIKTIITNIQKYKHCTTHALI